MKCPQCGEPMVPTTERGARWYCRSCVLLVRPMNPDDEFASGRRPPPDLLRGTAESWEWVKARRRAVADVETPILHVKIRARPGAIFDPLWIDIDHPSARNPEMINPGCRLTVDVEGHGLIVIDYGERDDARPTSAVAEGSQPSEVGPDGRFPSTDDKSRANPS